MKKNRKAQFHYDRGADVLGVYVKKGREEEFMEIAPNVLVELDRDGKVIGIEISNASKILKPLIKASTRHVPASAK
ncbi:MAG: DUF2283 domain-containing protein [Patescibacteria group bacterium]